MCNLLCGSHSGDAAMLVCSSQCSALIGVSSRGIEKDLKLNIEKVVEDSFSKWEGCPFSMSKKKGGVHGGNETDGTAYHSA